jgi:hypothetical protein
MPVTLVETVSHFRLVIEQIQMRRSAGLKQEDHALGAGRKIRKRCCRRSRLRTAEQSM